ncbi:hypothetical protein V1523DRAFT_425516 [Lipomyces doorenjongii]
MCLASDTEVRTTDGDKRVRDVQIGDTLYDAQDRQTPCIGVAPATHKLKTITFRKFDSSEYISFTCAPDYRLSLITTGISPSTSGKSVTWFTRCDRTSSYIPSSQPHPPDDPPRSSSPLSDSSSMELDKAAQDRFAAIRKSLDSINCDCGGLRKVHRRFKSEGLAQLALKILQSDRHHLLDPLIVRDGETFSMTVDEYERLCCKVVKRDNLKVYRVPLAFDPSTVSADPQALPLDGYYLGSWIGDGDANSTAIASSASDPETPVWLQSYTDSINSSGRPSDNKLSLTKTLAQAAGTKTSIGNVRKSDVFWYRIAGRPRRTNPVLDGLRELGLLGNKKAGIPRAYMEADEDTRLKVIAGLIDSDGNYHKSHSRYLFIQGTENHKKIVYDLHKLATSCGISVNDVHIYMVECPFTGRHTPTYRVYLGKGSEKFQKHLLLPRKKMNLEHTEHTYKTHDARPFTVSDAPAGECTAIQVRGGQFQLANRLVVFDYPARGETDTQTLSSQQVQYISAPPAPTVSESPSSSSKAASTTQPEASTSKSSQKSTLASTKKSSSRRKPLQPKPDSQLNARNSTSLTAMKETYLDPSENALVEAERPTAAMVLLGDEERGLIPSDDEDTPDSVMPDASDEPNQPTLPPKNSPSKSRSATPRLSATQRPRGGTKITTPRSSSSATSTPDVTITTAETTIIESEIQPERIEQVPPMPTTCPMPVLLPEPAITGPAPIKITDYVPRKRKLIVVDEPLIPKY